MAISTEIIRNDHVGNGVLDTYPFEFIIYDQDDLDVYVDGTLKTVDIHYTIAAGDVDNPNGGNVVFGGLYVPPNLSEIALLSGLAYTQETVLPSRDETYEDTYDKAVVLIKQLKEMLGRGLLLSTSSIYSGLSLPDPEAEYYLRWKADLSGLENIVGAGGGSGGDFSLLDVDVTISAGVITVSDGSAHYIVDTEGGAASDPLDRVTGLSAGDVFTISAKNDARTVIITNGTYFKTAGGLNCNLSNSLYEIMFRMGAGNVAYELTRSSNA